ncbi:odorant receptor 4-like isoform X2 [Temnothorax longispinosus]|uniref:odorant receptor 4-like isoform X2 n=1 Tax=Temnothorax longispinosus TaxID=300112 RepID=UPI003A9A5F92
MKQIPTSTINRSIEIPLRIFGIWPGLPYISFCRLFWTITVVAVQSFQYRYLITHFYTVDFSDLMDGLSATLGYSQFFSKLIIFWLKQRDTRFVYGLVLVIQFFCTVLYGSAAVMLNALLIVLVLHLAGQLEILDKWLSDIISKDNEYRLSVKTIRKIIEKHQNIIIFSKNIKNLYSDIALILFMSDTLIICSIDFLLVRSIGNPDSATILMKFVGFYAAVTSEVFMFCFAGEYLSAKSRAIGDAAYNSQWYQCRFQDSRIILFLIMRSQNQLTITIGKFMDLSFERFLNIMKASASYVSVMLAMY